MVDEKASASYRYADPPHLCPCGGDATHYVHVERTIRGVAKPQVGVNFSGCLDCSSGAYGRAMGHYDNPAHIASLGAARISLVEIRPLVKRPPPTEVPPA